GLLDQKSLNACSAVNRHWAFLVNQVQEEQECWSIVQQSLLQLRELCPKKPVPNYARRVDVQIPKLNKEGEVIEVEEKEQNKRRKSKTEDFSLHAAYRELKTHKIKLEERNVFCGSYKSCVLMEKTDRRRIVHYSGGDLVAATASANRKVRLLRVPGGKEVPLLLRGHAGPIRALHLCQEKGLLLSTSFDVNIRCWNIPSGACVRTFTGHYGTITCLDSHKEHLVSGAGDGMVKVWSLTSGKCVRTLMHNSPVWAVRMDGTHVVSGCHRGLVKVWSTETGALIKTLERHQGPVLCLSFDQWHLVTGSSDGYALGWSILGKFRRCVIAFFHPKEVVSLEFLHLRVISGCADGHIRIFNFLTGTCLRVLMPTSSRDPMSSLHVAGNRIVTNSPSRLVLFQFEDVVWDYSLPADREGVKKEKSRRGKRQDASTEQQRAQEPQDKSPSSRQSPKSHGRPKSITLSFCFSGFSKLTKQGPAPPAPDEAEATLQHELPKRDPSRPMSLDKFLLTISTLQKSCKPAPVHSSTELSAKAREAQEQCPEKGPMSKTLLQPKEEQAAQIQHARLHSESLTMTKISTPFETKMLRLKLKNSLHSPTVKSSIPAPCLIRPRFCDSLREKKTPSGHGKYIASPKDRDEFIGLCTASSELMKPTPGSTAQMKNEVPRTIKPFCPYGSRRDSEFRLLTAEQEAHEAAAAAQCQTQQAEPMEDEERARRKAWLRKIKGLPVDYFTGERKTLAPELGHNTFI
ncbi:FBW10 protein, partial [Grantiella picta]|nr:FBW10 protein [Grantiella picta]